MDIRETLKSALKQLTGNKARTILTMLGMFIGIGAVIMILALGTGFTKSITDSFGEIGLGVFQINVKEEVSENYITPEELEIIRNMEAIECVIAGNDADAVLYNHKGERFTCEVQGAQPEFTNNIAKQEILAGRNLTDQDEASYNRCVLIADCVAQALFGHSLSYEEIIGESINLTIEKQPNSFTIIGIYETSMASNLSQKELEKTIGSSDFFIPYSVLEQITGMEGKISIIAGKIIEGYDQVSITTQISQILNKRHHLKDGYEIQTYVQILEMVEMILNTITLFISAVASISLVVGGVGIMNIMLVTVKERTREIGVRKALGAPNGAILKQFILEALMLTIIAGLIGMLLGYVGAILIGSVMNIQAQFTLSMLLFSTVTSVVIGLVFGVYPAYQAAQLDPVEALRAD
ncbi:MAG: FtsX-like permease family protein [Cellulosilyticum sp.]|nr:FtsX-like permease family protein [Cellulosilyticum sp.]